MTGQVPGEHERQSVSRPFLAGLRPTRDAVPPTDDDTQAEAIRPYFVTGGRVPEDVSGFETVYLLTPGGAAGMARLAFEHRDIAALCRTPQSVVEISALLRLPLGVTTVLTRDLAGQGYLVASTPIADPASDPSLIMRLINAVHAL
jgi:hypothetical protein